MLSVCFNLKFNMVLTVYTVCHRLLYKSSVMLFNESKYANESNVLKTVMSAKYRHVIK